MNAIAEKLISRLDGVIPRGDGKWYARCPAHEDKSPSLSIRETDGRLLIHCFAGCSAEDVLDGIGLAWRDLYRDPWIAAHHAATANQGARFAKRLLRDTDPMDMERLILRIAAAELRAGKMLSVEDCARIEVARIRLAEGEAGAST